MNIKAFALILLNSNTTPTFDNWFENSHPWKRGRSKVEQRIWNKSFTPHKKEITYQYAMYNQQWKIIINAMILSIYWNI